MCIKFNLFSVCIIFICLLIGFMTDNEREVFEKLHSRHNNFFAPFVWATALVNQARKEGRIKYDSAVNQLFIVGIPDLNTFSNWFLIVIMNKTLLVFVWNTQSGTHAKTGKSEPAPCTSLEGSLLWTWLKALVSALESSIASWSSWWLRSAYTCSCGQLTIGYIILYKWLKCNCVM